MLQVGEVARQLGINTQTLYFYERIGLMRSPPRSESGYRLYSDADLERLSFILQAKDLGLTLEEIGEILTLKEGRSLTCREVHDRLVQKVQQIENQIQKLQALRHELLPLVDRCRTSLEDEQRQCTVLENRDA
ncbi:MAG: heavy metal-responsive transcriptional regulator [Spirulinaceae cyanobacterium]